MRRHDPEHAAPPAMLLHIAMSAQTYETTWRRGRNKNPYHMKQQHVPKTPGQGAPAHAGYTGQPRP